MHIFLQAFKHVAEQNGLTISGLEAQLGASKGVFSRALANGTDIQSKWLLKLVENYPDLNPEWLLTGKGAMLKPAGKAAPVAGTPTAPPATPATPTTIATTAPAALPDQGAYIAALLDHIATLKHTVALLQAELNGLKTPPLPTNALVHYTPMPPPAAVAPVAQPRKKSSAATPDLATP
ncbi:MAG: XRE family transcriptional regulator [Bacteroidetes bacterium]|nr:MAG: XRE family transcriptional regulator [Bacteroidota bacterium]